MLHRDPIPLAEGATDIIDILVVKDREKPSTQIGSGLPKMLFGDRADQGILYEVVGAHGIPGQCARITPQLWNFGLEQRGKGAH
jgi:hypothetical protein